MWLSFCFIFLQIPTIYSYNFLVINPVFAFSHYKFLTTLANSLAESGHNVTMFQYYHNYLPAADKFNKHENIEIIKYFHDKYEESEKLSRTQSYWLANPAKATFEVPNILLTVTKNTTTQLLKDTHVLNMLKTRNFDSVILELFDSTGLTISHLINAKSVIPTYSMVQFFSPEKVFGQPSQLGYIPSIGSPIALNAGFLDRLNDILMYFVTEWNNNKLLDLQWDLHRSIIGEELPHWTKMLEKAPYLFINSNPYIDYAFPSTKNIIPIGGFTIDKNDDTSIPEEYQKILKEKKATVFVSFGSVARSIEMPESFKSGVIEMFNTLQNITFIWKYEDENDEELKSRLQSNVHIRKWAPQTALLADERVKLFITHCGLGSTLEVAYSGKPALLVPLFGDQQHNAQMLSRHGGTKILDRYVLSDGKKLAQIIDEMISNPIYKHKAMDLAEILENQPIKPIENFLKYAEFAVKFSDYKGQIPEISNVGIVAFYYLDVYILLSGILVFVIFVFFKLLRIVSECIRIRSTKNKIAKND